jgi:hypothetical protein
MLFFQSALLLYLMLRIVAGASRWDWTFLFLLSLTMVYTSFLSGILLLSIFFALLAFARTLRRGRYRIVRDSPGLPDCLTTRMDDAGWLRLLPHRDEMDSACVVRMMNEE